MRIFLERYRLPLLAGIFLAVAVGYLFWGGDRAGPLEEPPHTGDSPEQIPAAFTVNADSRLIYQVSYDQCGHTEILRERSPSDEIGLTLDTLRTIYRDWTVSNSGANVVLTTAVEGLCEQCRSNVFVGVYEGRVAVYYGEPGENCWLKEITEIPVGNLPFQEQKDLETGIRADSEDDLLQIMEGLMN